jgi:hypothetical protein
VAIAKIPPTRITIKAKNSLGKPLVTYTTTIKRVTKAKSGTVAFAGNTVPTSVTAMVKLPAIAKPKKKKK